MAKKNTKNNDSKSGKKTELKKHNRSDSRGKNKKGTGPRDKK